MASRCGDELGEADAVVTLRCDAFSFKPDGRYKFGPDDQVMDIYRARYRLAVLFSSPMAVSMHEGLGFRRYAWSISPRGVIRVKPPRRAKSSGFVVSSDRTPT